LGRGCNDRWVGNAGADYHPGDRSHHFGAGKLPQIGEGLGKGIRNFKKATSDPLEASSEKVDKIEEKVSSDKVS